MMGKPHCFNSCSVLLNAKVISFIQKIRTQTGRFRYICVHLARRFWKISLKAWLKPAKTFLTTRQTKKQNQVLSEAGTANERANWLLNLINRWMETFQVSLLVRIGLGNSPGQYLLLVLHWLQLCSNTCQGRCIRPQGSLQDENGSNKTWSQTYIAFAR